MLTRTSHGGGSRLRYAFKAVKETSSEPYPIWSILTEIDLLGAATDYHCHELFTLVDSHEPVWTNRKVAQKWHSSRKMASTKSP